MLFLFTGSIAYSQGTISGIVKDAQNKPIAGATVALHDAATQQISVTNSDGTFGFTKLKNGSYSLTVNYVGLKAITFSPVILEDAHRNIKLPPIILQPAGGQVLKEVFITSKKPLVEQQIDRTVVNVDAMITSGSSNALEILAKSPGVSVDINDDIKLNGKNNVLLLIDDRPTYLSAQGLAAYLKSLPGGMLDKLELISNPPARYDASGNAVINIVLKKNQARGFNGALSLGYNRGKYARSNDAVNVNYRTAHFNLFGNIGYSHDGNFSDQTFDRSFPDKSILQNSNYNYQSNGYNGRVGLDYFASPKTTLGIIFSGSTRPKSDELTFINHQYNAAMQLDSLGRGSTTGNYTFKNYAVNLNLQHRFNDKGRVLTISLDRVKYSTDGNQLSPLEVYLPDGTLLSDLQRMFIQPANVHIYAGKADYTHPLAGKTEFSAGIKSSYVTTDNQLLWYDDAGGSLEPDYSKTNHFRYFENINSAYLNLKKELQRWSAQAGLRLENTNANGRQFANPANSGAVFAKHYTSLFPSLYLLRKLDSTGNNTLTLSYSKRIRRPSYQQLNPFLFYQDQYTYNAGNPGLSPSTAQYLELRYSYRHYFGITLSYGGGNNGINSVTQADGDVFVTSPLNFLDNQMFGIIPYLSLNPARWWTANLNAVIIWQTIKGTAAGVIINQRTNIHEIETTNQFILGKTWSAELDGFFPGSQTFGQSKNSAIYNISAGIQKSILQGQGSVRLNVNDIFKALDMKGQTLGINGVTALNTRQTDSRWISLSFNYRFGKTVNARKRNDSSSAEDEKGRTN